MVFEDHEVAATSVKIKFGYHFSISPRTSLRPFNVYKEKPHIVFNNVRVKLNIIRLKVMGQNSIKANLDHSEKGGSSKNTTAVIPAPIINQITNGFIKLS